MGVSRTEQAAVVNGDVASYSRLTADNEIETHQTLQAFRKIVDQAALDHGGELVEFVGDEFLAVLPSASEGVGAAISIQRSLAGENERLPAGRKMRFRLGVNYGSVSVEEGQWFGDAINIAARLQAMAKPGGICVSGPALDAAGEISIRVVSLGRQRLKNIPEPVLAYEIVDAELPTGDTKPWRRRIPTSDRPSIAASPFVNFGDADDGHFANGLMMSLVIELMTIPGLDVVSENSSLGYRDQAYSAQQIGHELGVRYVLEGGIQRSGSRVRVLAQVIDVETATTVWADRFETEIDDVFAAQDHIVARIVEALDIEVIGGDLPLPTATNSIRGALRSCTGACRMYPWPHRSPSAAPMGTLRRSPDETRTAHWGMPFRHGCTSGLHSTTRSMILGITIRLPKASH